VTAATNGEAPSTCSVARIATSFGLLRQHTSAYVSIRRRASAYVSVRQHTSAYISMDCASHI
jgi:hypothetical protein